MLGQKQAEEAIVPTAANEVEHGGGKEEGEEADVGEQPQNSVFQMKNLLWHGGSAWDAWFSCASNQVKFSLKSPGTRSEFRRKITKSLYFSVVCVKFLQVAQVLLTLPYSFSQLGMLSGIIFQIFYGLIGSWTAYLISVLYIEYRSRKEKENVNFKNHVIQVPSLKPFSKGYSIKPSQSKSLTFNRLLNCPTQTLSLVISPLLNECMNQLQFDLELMKRLRFWFVVVRSAWWTLGTSLEGLGPRFQLYFPSVRICHPAYWMRKVTISKVLIIINKNGIICNK